MERRSEFRELMKAIEDGVEIVVAGLIAENPQLLEQRDFRGYTPLLLATSNDAPNPACIRPLIEAGADVNAVMAKDWRGYTPLMFAVEHTNRDADSIRALIEAGADVNAQTAEGYSALHIAVGDSGYTFGQYGDCATADEILPLLVGAGARLDAVNHYGHTPLMHTMVEGTNTHKSLRALLAVGADPNSLMPHTQPPVFNEGQNMLSLAWVELDPAPVMQLLLEAGADPHLRDRQGRTTLEYIQAIKPERYVTHPNIRPWSQQKQECLALLEQAMAAR